MNSYAPCAGYCGAGTFGICCQHRSGDHDVSIGEKQKHDARCSARLDYSPVGWMEQWNQAKEERRRTRKQQGQETRPTNMQKSAETNLSRRLAQHGPVNEGSGKTTQSNRRSGRASNHANQTTEHTRNQQTMGHLSRRLAHHGPKRE